MGEKAKAMEIAEKLLATGMTISEVSSLVGLPESELETL